MRKITVCFIVVALLISLLAPVGRAEAATDLQYEEYVVSEDAVYSIRNVASGWYMNVRHAGTSNGTEVNLYPLDMTEPMTQRFVFRVIDAGKKIVTISPQPTKNKYLDVRRNGKAFASGQGICLWEADGDPIKNLVLDFEEDGSFYLSFAKYPDYCIGAKNLSAASTEQTQLVVRKKENAPELRWILCTQNGLPVMDVENNINNWSNPYYEKYGQDYIDLFKDNPLYLSNDAFSKITGFYFEECNRVLKEHEKDTLVGSFLYALDNGKEVIMYELLSKAGLSKSFEEKIRFESIKCLMQDICNDKNVLYTMMNEIQEDFEVLDTSYSLMDATSKTKYINDLAKATSLPTAQIEKSVNSAFEKGGKIKENGTLMVECITTGFQLYCLEQSMIDYLMDSIDTECDMYHDLKLLKSYTGKNVYKHLIETVLSEKSLEIISDSLSKLIGKASYDLASVVVDIGVSVLVNNVYQGALADEIVQTTCLYSYAMTLENTLSKMQLEFMDDNHVVTVEEIERYEVVFSAYVSALKTMAKSAMKMDGKMSSIQTVLKNSESVLNYDSYMKSCLNNMPSVQKKLDELVEKLDGKYFTVDQKACYSSRTYNCNVENVINANWLKNSFLNGESISAAQFPKLTVSSSGKSRGGFSCFGFACFVQWYLFSGGIKDNVTASTVATGKYNKEFIQKNVMVGDALRVMGTKGAHTLVVYSVDENGITVVDSNFYLDCKVKKHLISYTHASFLNCTVYVDRVVD